jgi:MFS family permease
MLPLGLFAKRQFTVTNVVTFLIYAALGGVLFLLPVELQVVDRYTPLESGIALLPLTVIMLLLSARSAQLASQIGPRLQMSAGPLVIGAGLALLARSTTDSSYVSGVLPAMVVFGLGLATTVAPLTSTALSAVADEHAGVASAVNNDVARVGGLMAVAVLPALAGISGSSYLRPAELAGGFRSAALIAASWCVIGGVVSAIGIRNPPQRTEGPTEGPSTVEAPMEACLHCALDATPLNS